MNNKERSYRIAYEALILLCVITLLSFICRLWPIILLALMGLIFAAIRLLFLKWKREEKEEAVVPAVEESTHEPCMADVYDLAFSLILTQITSLVLHEFDGARWVWETVNPKNTIKNGNDVFILLSGAGGYRRAKVKITALRAEALEYVTSPISNSEKPNGDRLDVDSENEVSGDEELSPVNYELIAFEWVEAHILELNTRLNETIGEGKEYLLLTPEELPAREGWEKLCSELLRADIPDAECTEEGIRIYFMPKKAERE